MFIISNEVPIVYSCVRVRGSVVSLFSQKGVKDSISAKSRTLNGQHPEQRVRGVFIPIRAELNEEINHN